MFCLSEEINALIQNSTFEIIREDKLAQNKWKSVIDTYATIAEKYDAAEVEGSPSCHGKSAVCFREWVWFI
jgi:hypothetical protein